MKPTMNDLNNIDSAIGVLEALNNGRVKDKYNWDDIKHIEYLISQARKSYDVISGHIKNGTQ